jgi:hypothetical protein
VSRLRGTPPLTHGVVLSYAGALTSAWVLIIEILG